MRQGPPGQHNEVGVPSTEQAAGSCDEPLVAHEAAE
jgi:hypothetical protein